MTIKQRIIFLMIDILLIASVAALCSNKNMLKTIAILEKTMLSILGTTTLMKKDTKNISKIPTLITNITITKNMMSISK